MFSNLDNPLLANFQGYNASFSPDWKKIVTMLGLLIVHIRRFSAYVHSIQANMWQMVLSLPMFWLATILFEYPLNISAFIKSWLGIVYMGLAVNAIAFVV
ncbi:hypothetical protein [Fischerella sp. PCC 9605]|uniref:hypothetical protein n=1 Tax=Fischerella sp. PCC 9605 TaxID=1173024 RepID=UPI0004B9C992|nr:hypothetical protein [Fischerella sp. PCC 9605]